jgi:hypothetical protein
MSGSTAVLEFPKNFTTDEGFVAEALASLGFSPSLFHELQTDQQRAVLRLAQHLKGDAQIFRDGWGNQ